MKRVVFLVLVSMSLASAGWALDLWTHTEPTWDGNQIPEPNLLDYRSGNRAPGILDAPHDIINARGEPIGEE